MNIVGTFLKYQDEFVILRRQVHKPNGGLWGLPAGKVEPGENVVNAAIRELFEETGYKANKDELKFLGKFEFGEGEGKYTFNAYECCLDSRYQITLEDSAHNEARYVSPVECYEMDNLIPDFHELLIRIRYITVL